MFEGGGGTEGGFVFVDRVRETDREGKTQLRDRKLRGGVQGGDLRFYGRFAPRTALNW